MQLDATSKHPGTIARDNVPLEQGLEETVPCYQREGRAIWEPGVTP